MHVVLNAQLISAQQTYRSAGVSNYSRNLVSALDTLAPSQQRLRLTALTGASELRTRHVHLQPTAASLDNPSTRIAWEQLVLPRLLHKLDADIVHGLVNVLPLATNVPGVVTVHDLSFLHMPHLFPAAKRLYLTLMCQASVRKAAAVIAVSQQTARDVIRRFDVPPHKVIVVYNGVDARFAPDQPDDIEVFRRERRLPTRFFLFVGTLEPRKNLDSLLTAYARWRNQAPAADQDVRLVIAGGKGWFYESLFARAAALDLQDYVIFPGYIPDHELPNWYRAALGFVYPSLFEGFGLPVLEAMACGTPVICSNIPALREVAADAAVLLPPTDTAAWSNALSLLVTQTPMAKLMVAKGIQRATQFGWPRSAETTLGVYRETCLKAGY